MAPTYFVRSRTVSCWLDGFSWPTSQHASDGNASSRGRFSLVGCPMANFASPMSDLDVREKVKLLPRQPGVYQFLDAEGTIIYVGKAIDLRSRVGSYFGAQGGMSGKTLRLVRNIMDLRTMVVATEFDALLLENS